MRPLLAADPLRTMARLHQRVRKLEHRFLDSGGIAIYEIKVFDDQHPVLAGDGAFDWPIPEELDGAVLVAVEAGVSTVSSSGAIQVQLRKFEVGSGDMLTTKLTIDSGERNAKDSATQAVIDTGNDDVAWGGWIAIDVDAAGTGAMGLTLKAAFSPSALASIVLEGAKGAKGDPGGITTWTGAWDSGTTYAAGDAVSNNGTSYVARTGSIAVEPGVTASWETYWMVLADAGTQSVNYESRATNTILGVSDKGKVIDITASITQTFDPGATLGDGWWVILRNATDEGSIVVTLNPDGTETIDGLTTTVTMYSGETRLIVSNGDGTFDSVLLSGGYARFTANGSFVVPHGATQFRIACYGAGGGGGGGRGDAAGSVRQGGAGGGGGACTEKVMPASLLGNPGDSITVTLGTGGGGGNGNTSADGSNGAAGGTTTFGSLLSGFGGGGGIGGSTTGGRTGGGGGGLGEAGQLGQANANSRGGGNPTAGLGGQGGSGGGCNVSNDNAYERAAEYGGGGGGRGSATGALGTGGGASIHGGGGGGAGGGLTSGNAENAGADGGLGGAYQVGGGGGGGAANGFAGTAGTARSATSEGSGGGGGGSQDSGTGGAGGQGGAGGHGGGGGAGGTTTGGNGGAGGDGECRVWYS